MPGEYLPLNYIPIFLFIGVAVIFGVVNLVVGALIRPTRPDREKTSTYESGIVPFSDARNPFPIRYYVIAMLFLVFDIETVFLYPWAVVFNKIGLYAIIEMVLFICILLVGYFYAWKRGALEWD